jgi:hypothetical protein
VGTGIFIQQTQEESDSKACTDEEITATISQAEITGISIAAMVLECTRNRKIAIITDSLSSLQSLQNPEVRTKTKHECIHNLNALVKSNSITLNWVPVLANLGGALDTLNPEPSPPIAQTVIKQKIKGQRASENDTLITCTMMSFRTIYDWLTLLKIGTHM